METQASPQQKEVKPFCSRVEAEEHIKAVAKNIENFVAYLEVRAIYHDASKFDEAEYKVRDRWIPVLRKTEYGSPEYDYVLLNMGDAIEHHHARNSHHPEHYKDGVAGMDLFDLVEMFCDWKAAAERDGDKFNPEPALRRYKVEPQLAQIIRNTVERW